MAPHSMRDSDMLRPIPRAPPVTTMTFPARLKRRGTLLSLPASTCAWTWAAARSWSWAWSWAFDAGTWAVVVEDGVSGIDASLVVVCPVGASVTSETVAVGLKAFSVWDS